MSGSAKVVLITGASGGLGRAVALRFGQGGWTVAVNYRRNREGAEETCRLVRAAGGTAMACAADVADCDEVERMVEAVERETGGIGALVNNAGVVLRKPFLETEAGDWDDVFGINVRGTFLTGQAVARRMIGRGTGAIINISSIWGQVATASRAAYSATKGAVDALTKAMAIELAPYGLRVNAVAPGIMSTEGVVENLSRAGLLAEYGRHMPAGRLGTPEECAEAVYFLAGNEAQLINGAVLVVDGGLSSRQLLPTKSG